MDLPVIVGAIARRSSQCTCAGSGVAAWPTTPLSRTGCGLAPQVYGSNASNLAAAQALMPAPTPSRRSVETMLPR